MIGSEGVYAIANLAKMERDGVEPPGETFQNLWIARRARTAVAVIVAVVVVPVYPVMLVFPMCHCSLESLIRFLRPDGCGSEKKTP